MFSLCPVFLNLFMHLSEVYEAEREWERESRAEQSREKAQHNISIEMFNDSHSALHHPKTTSPFECSYPSYQILSVVDVLLLKSSHCQKDFQCCCFFFLLIFSFLCLVVVVVVVVVIIIISPFHPKPSISILRSFPILPHISFGFYSIRMVKRSHNMCVCFSRNYKEE